MLLALTLSVQAAPGGPPAATAHRHGGGGHPWVLFDMEQAEVSLWTSDLRTLEVLFDGHWAHLPKSGVDNYHAAVAVQRSARLSRSVVRYLFRQGRPSGHSPRELLAEHKAPLELVPDPLPREHYRYYGGEAWGFLLRLYGKPVADTEVRLRTLNGSDLTARTDGAGRVRFTLPDDFPRVLPGRRANPAVPFALSAATATDGVRYETTLQGDYAPNPGHWRSTEWGAATLGAGLLAGLLITAVGRRREGAK
ncbi:hypothetical protein JCM17961_40710 [Endothiovibrio diazotrophicus]